MKNLKKNEVTHHNDLIKGTFEDFELRELKLFFTLISIIKESEKTYFLNAQNIKKFIGMGQKSYEDFEKIIIRLQKRIIKIKNKEKYRTYNIFSVLEFDSKEQTVEIKYNPEFFPFLVDFEGNFTKFYLNNIEKLKSKYSIFLYIMGKSDLWKGKMTFTIEELKEKFIINPLKKCHFDEKIITPAIEEINLKTDLKIEVEKIYKKQLGTKSVVEGYKFLLSKNIIISESLEKAIKNANKNHFILSSKVLNNDTINILLNEFEEEEIIKGLKYAYLSIKEKFTKLQYLKTIIYRSQEVEIENIEQKKNVLKTEKKKKKEEIGENLWKEHELSQLDEEKGRKLVIESGMKESALNNLKKSQIDIYKNVIILKLKEANLWEE